MDIDLRKIYHNGVESHPKDDEGAHLAGLRAVWNAAVEECAKTCDDYAVRYSGSRDERDQGFEAAAELCASSIRALGKG